MLWILQTPPLGQWLPSLLQCNFQQICGTNSSLQTRGILKSHTVEVAKFPLEPCLTPKVPRVLLTVWRWSRFKIATSPGEELRLLVLSFLRPYPDRIHSHLRENPYQFYPRACQGHALVPEIEGIQLLAISTGIKSQALEATVPYYKQKTTQIMFGARPTTHFWQTKSPGRIYQFVLDTYKPQKRIFISPLAFYIIDMLEVLPRVRARLLRPG